MRSFRLIFQQTGPILSFGFSNVSFWLRFQLTLSGICLITNNKPTGCPIVFLNNYLLPA